MTYHVTLKPRAEKELNDLPEKIHHRITLALATLAKNPFLGKKLDGEYRGCYSIRVWPYRVIYQIYKKELLVLVIRIGHRREVY